MNKVPYIVISMLFFIFWLTPKGYAQEKHSIVCSASMFTDMMSNLATDDFEISTIVPIGGDPHKYRARPSDARLVQKADLILINGLTFEGWINELIENSGTNAKVVLITEGVEAITSLQYKNSFDPHAWMDASNGFIYIKNMYEALVDFMPAKKDIFKANYEAYLAKLQELDKNIEQEIQKIPENQRVLITSHDAFQYYGERYGMKLEAIMGISTEAQAQTSDIMRVADAIKKNNVPAIFIESTINPKMLQQIAKDNKVSIGGELYADSLGDEKSPGSTYIDMLWHNTTTIVQALAKKITESTGEPKENKNPDLTSDLPLSLKIIVAACLLMTLLVVIITKMKKR